MIWLLDKTVLVLTLLVLTLVVLIAWPFILCMDDDALFGADE